jgi:two-component system nitrate/nitrite response regulator NarL
MHPIAQPPIRLLVIDDHMIVRAGLAMLTHDHPRFLIVSEAGTASDALKLEVECDVILLDLDLGEENGLDFIAPLLKRHPGAKILILTGSRAPVVGSLAIAAGAMGIVMKDHAPEALLKAIECVHRGEFWMDRTLTASILHGFRDAPSPKVDPEKAKIALLTPRESEVIALIGEGLKNREIAARLFLSETTVRHHLTSIFSKLDVSDRLELVIYAYRNYLIEPK